uniref:Dynein regulatory complex subunit 4 n=1 Tax=Oncorhynchus mykiss TaxID=8022 RepID=A0A8C7TYU3_ONCMY
MERLEEHIVRLREELDREREERNYFQMERDKIHTFWKADLRNRDREMKEAEERHQVEIKVYKQKVKHLLYEHQNSISELKGAGVVSNKLMQKEHAELENEFCKGMRTLKEQELSNENLIKGLKLVYALLTTQINVLPFYRILEIEAKYETKMQMLRQEQDLRRKTEIHEIDERKNSQINTLMKNHEKAFSNIKNYYNDITLNNLSLINSLKEMKRKEERLEKDMAEVLLHNKRLTEPLQKAKEEVTELQKQLTNYEKDKTSLAPFQIWDREESEKKIGTVFMRLRVQVELDDLYKKFTQAIQEVQQKSGFMNLLLERKLGALTNTLEKKEAQLNALVVVTRKLEEVVDSKNIAIKDLQYELARVCKAHDDLLRTYEAKLHAFGIPMEELGFKPLESSVAGHSLGQGPAGLVSAPT